MIKFDDLLNQAKSISGLSGTKYILSTATNNSGALDGAELIPIDLGGRLVSQSPAPIPVNDLGKQLLRASASGDVDAVKALLTRGAPFTTDWLGTSPLHFAAQNNHLEITEILLRAGISKDAKTKVERTPLHLAVFEGYTEIVDTLVKHGADIECRDLLDMTPLHWAVQRGYLDVVECLIRNGAQIDVQNKFDLTPLNIAQQVKRSDIECRINDSLRNAAAVSQNLVIQLSSDGNENQDCAEDMELDSSNHESIIIPIEPSMMSQFVNETSEPEEELSQSGNDEYFQEQDPESIEKENEQLVSNVNVDTANFSDSLKLLQAHGITMLQTDENEDGNILNTVMESGHSVVLTDVGKEVLNSVKQSEQQRQLQMQKKIVQVTPEEFLAMANGTVGNKNVYKQLKVLPSKGQVKRIVVKKGKAVPITNVSKINTEQSSPNQPTNTPPSSTEMELMMAQLIEARKTIEEYKIKLKKKEQEVEEYKLQIKVLLDPKYC